MFSDPVKNLKAFGLREDMIVADLGAGSGFYTIPLSKIVDRGKVYAIDIQKDFLTTIKNKAKDEHLHNVEFLLGDVEKIGGTKLRDGIIDAGVASNILFQIEDRNTFIEEIKRILKPGGKLLLIDGFSNGAFKNVAENISKEKAREIFEKKGFAWEREIDAGAHHYGMILRKL
jgi:ubiquinone/menaquinone biosynthesis C-methylase UbiE